MTTRRNGGTALRFSGTSETDNGLYSDDFTLLRAAAVPNVAPPPSREGRVSPAVVRPSFFFPRRSFEIGCAVSHEAFIRQGLSLESERCLWTLRTHCKKGKSVPSVLFLLLRQLTPPPLPPPRPIPLLQMFLSFLLFFSPLLASAGPLAPRTVSILAFVPRVRRSG